jgi:DDE superfamily endonuclease
VSKRILVIVSEDGYWAEELVGPPAVFDQQGVQITLAKPAGNRPPTALGGREENDPDSPPGRSMTAAESAAVAEALEKAGSLEPAAPRVDRLAGASDALSDYCGALFGSLPRSDQRRWAETYVRGLLATPGRKTLAAISEQVLGRRAIQPLQQFVNQSTWDHAAVRSRLSALAAATIRPRAWAIEEVAFPKNGANSVGVAKQFAYDAGRTLNCQLALVLSLVGEDTDVPANWRLMLPECWDSDHERRTKSHLPEQEHHQPRWRHALSLVDELFEDWHIPVAPVLIDGTAEPDVEPLLSGLESRGLSYIVSVAPGAAVRQAGGSAGAGALQSMSAAQCVRVGMYREERATVSWAEGVDGGRRQSQFLAVPVPGLGGAASGQGLRPNGRRMRTVIAEWPAGSDRARDYWVTNLAVRSLAQVVSLAKLRSRPRATVAALHSDFGLGDFEGRSFRGWHHHVTLVSAAASFPGLATRATLAAARFAA